MTEDAKPTYAELRALYDELLALLRAAPPRQMVSDQRYWDWRRQVEALLARLEEGA